MRPYEVMVIFESTTEPPVIQGIVDQVAQTIRDTGGNLGEIDRWGKRNFAYEVDHRREGYYILIEFTSQTQTVFDLDRMLGLADEVIRHKIIRLPEKVAGRKPVRSPRGSNRPARGTRPSKEAKSTRSESSGVGSASSSTSSPVSESIGLDAQVSVTSLGSDGVD